MPTDEPTWSSLPTHPFPSWLREAKLGKMNELTPPVDQRHLY